MLCFRCGSHVEEGVAKCWHCGADLAPRRRIPTSDLRARRSGLLDVVHSSGDEIGQRYRVKDILGSGGAGVVYRAYDREQDLDVAVKIISSRLVDTPARRQSLIRQIKVARRLSHPNCVRVFDDALHDERPFMVMPFLEGLSLRRIIDLRLEKGRVFAPSELEPIFDQLCQALDYAHDRTFHGNLKPDNVIVLPDLLKVTDFPLVQGLPRAPFLALQRERGRNLCYLAPEVRTPDDDPGRAADIYSLGVILLEMLTGHVHDDADPEALDSALGRIPVALADVARGCLPRSVEGRFRTAGALYKSLTAALTTAAPSGGAEPIDPPLPVAGVQAGSLAYRIDTSMIEAEASAPGGERWVTDPGTSDVALVTPLIDDGDLIDIPEASASDLIAADEDEEETQSLDEPTAEIRALWARLNRPLDEPEVIEGDLPGAGAGSVEVESSPTSIDDVPPLRAVVDGAEIDGAVASGAEVDAVGSAAPRDDGLTFRESSPRGGGAAVDPAEAPRPRGPVLAPTDDPAEASMEAPVESLPLGPLTRRSTSPEPEPKLDDTPPPAEARRVVPARRGRWPAVAAGVAAAVMALALMIVVMRYVDQQRRHRAEVAALRRQLTGQGRQRSPVTPPGDTGAGSGFAARPEGGPEPGTANPDLVAPSPRPRGGGRRGAAGPDGPSPVSGGHTPCASAAWPVASSEGRVVCVDARPSLRDDGTKGVWTNVTWTAAAAQCRARGQRLCTEAEWKRACRASDPAGFFGDESAGIAEWTSTADGDGYIVRGGEEPSATGDGRCGARRAVAGERSSTQLGFRCCTAPQ